MTKRTHTLKNIAALQNFDTDTNKLSESFLEPTTIPSIERHGSNTKRMGQPPEVADGWNAIYTNELSKVAKVLNVDIEELKMWFELHCNIPALTQLSLIRLMKIYGLDPFLEEVCFIQHEPGQWQANITVNGWCKIANQCSAFSGIHFQQSIEELENQIPIWIECTIYRTDRTIPITIREYYYEAKQNNALWEKMPRRMLRYRAFSQCARLALGI